MHGLINRGLQVFLTDTYGADTWGRIADNAGISREGFEALLIYDPAETQRVLDSAVALLGKPRETLFDDMGTYLVSHPTTEALRRLLRFGGIDFVDFMNSLDELPERAQLAVPDLVLPELETREVAPDAFEVRCRFEIEGIGQMVASVLRTMADDYGALVLIDYAFRPEAGERIEVRLLEGAFTEGREFELSARAGQ